jgi:hypothetical protein
VGTVEIESEWTFKARERMGIHPKFTKQPTLSSTDTPSIPILTPKEG